MGKYITCYIMGIQKALEYRFDFFWDISEQFSLFSFKFPCGVLFTVLQMTE